MANTAQARKRARQAVKQRGHNASQRSALRTAIKKIIKAVEDYAKAESGQYKAVFINNVMVTFRSFLLLLSKKYPGVRLTQDIQPDLSPVWAEEVTIEEILFNYTENAFHAALERRGH